MEIKDTIENGESEVQIATIGEVIGTGADGEPVVQNLTEESLQKLAEKHKDDELLVDADHESEMGGKTEAKGWLSGLKFIPGVGLFGKIKWTDIGRKLIENRVFRWLSPSWYLNKETKEPIQMTSVALTNKPSQAGRIDPIVNSAPVSNDFNKSNMEELEMTLTKEELVELIKQTIADLKKEEKVAELDKAIENENACHDDIVDNLEQEKQAVEAGVIQNSEPTKTKCQNECGDEKKTEVKNAEEDEVTEEVKEEVKEGKEEGKTEEEIKEEVKEEVKEESDKSEVKEEKKEEDEPETEDAEQVSEEEEVIKLESLNSQPKTEGIDIVKNSVSTTQTTEPQFTGIKVTRII